MGGGGVGRRAGCEVTTTIAAACHGERQAHASTATVSSASRCTQGARGGGRAHNAQWVPVPPFATVTAQPPMLTASAVLLVLTSRAMSCLPAGRAAGAHAGATLAAGSWHGCGARARVRCMAATRLVPGTCRCVFVGQSSTIPACIRTSGTAAAHLGHSEGEGTPVLPRDCPGLSGGLHRCACGPGCFGVLSK